MQYIKLYVIGLLFSLYASIPLEKQSIAQCNKKKDRQVVLPGGEKSIIVKQSLSEKTMVQNVTNRFKDIRMEEDEGCPAGFVRTELLPYNCYMLVLEGMTWFEALSNCKLVYDADLLYIVGSEEQVILESYIKNESIDFEGLKLQQIWIGIRKYNTGSWEWTKRGAKVEYTNWIDGTTPSILENSCGYMDSTSFQWGGIYCNTYRRFNGYNGPDDNTLLYASICKAPYISPTI